MNELNRYSNALRQTHSGAHQSASLLACAADPNFESPPLSRGKCVFIVLGWWELDARVYVDLSCPSLREYASDPS